MEEEKKFNAKRFAIILIVFMVIIIAIIYFLLNEIFTKNTNSSNSVAKTNSEIVNQTKTESIQAETTPVVAENEYAVKDNNLSKFDLSFLKFENEKENKIYSPLSIKYAFKMLEEATSGEAHQQISDIINAYNLTEYKSNENMALANAFFIRDSYKENIKESYINALKTKYNADIEFDDFSNAEKINTWVNNHTLRLIPELLADSDVGELNFALINALGIDMEWNHKFLKYEYEDDENITNYTEYNHARIPTENYAFGWSVDETIFNKKFDSNQSVASMKVYASLNNYDPIKELGEEEIRQLAYNDFKDWALGNGKYSNEYENGKNETEFFENDYSEEGIKKAFDKWFDKDLTTYSEEESKGYIESLKENYGKVDYSTDFSIYVDDNVKVFAKDLKEYEGTTLQYIGIMPINEDLNQYISNTTNEEILNTISKLKDLKLENFKDGYLTYIHGYIPKFNFEYELDLQNDLEKMGVTNVFEQGKANLTKMTDDEDVFIGAVKHKANIDFTQDGIKAAAATFVGGAGAGEWYDYYLEMPTEDIDISFDKPYMFLIKDKSTGETWFVGTVYEPLDIEDEPSENISPAWEEYEDNEEY